MAHAVSIFVVHLISKRSIRSLRLLETLHAAAKDAKAVLLANHGPVVSGKTLADAVHAAEELEESARLALLLRGAPARTLTPAQVDDLLSTFG